MSLLNLCPPLLEKAARGKTLALYQQENQTLIGSVTLHLEQGPVTRLARVSFACDCPKGVPSKEILASHQWILEKSSPLTITLYPRLLGGGSGGSAFAKEPFEELPPKEKSTPQEKPLEKEDPTLLPQLRDLLADKETPWHLSEKLYERIRAQPRDVYQKCPLSTEDPEWPFILKYFMHNKPSNRSIGAVHCLHNPQLTQAFESALSTMEERGKDPFFDPTWKKEDSHPDLRQKVIERFHRTTAPFTPCYIPRLRGADPVAHAKILPLWHGTNAAVCHSISKTGFTTFGTHDFFEGDPKKGKATGKVDIGFFGSGIYFTNNVRYSADVYSKSDGHLLLAWVSMREPYPVIADKQGKYSKDPQKHQEPSDMTRLKGKGAVGKYNAHYIPAFPEDPHKERCAIYFPCTQDQSPHLDELVVFNESQALPRFWIELQIDLPKSLSEIPPTAEALLKHLHTILERTPDPELQKLLQTKQKFLLALSPQETMTFSPSDQAFCHWALKLLDPTQKTRELAKQTLLTLDPQHQRRRLSILRHAPLIEKKLKNPHIPLTLEESIALLTTCIHYGEKEAEKNKDKDTLIFIGNTGAGKSTTANYLAGCTMELKDPQELGIEGLDEVITVKPESEGGKLREIMPIGHTKESKTFMPQIEQNSAQSLTYCDCPGFLDNRGAEINIANAVNIKNSLIQAKTLKALLLINYHSLKADRGRGLSDMLKIACDLFGTPHNLTSNKNSLLIGITNVPEKGKLEAIKKFVADGKLPIMEILSDRVFIFDPLDRPFKEGGWDRQTLLQKIEELTPIEDPSKMFRTVLTNEDEKKLLQISEQIGENIQRALQDKNYEKASFSLNQLKELSVIDHPTILRLIAYQTTHIERYIHTLHLEFRDHCNFKRFDDALYLKTHLQTLLTHFDPEIQKLVDFTKLDEYYASSKTQYDQERQRQQALEEELRQNRGEVKTLISLLDTQKQATEKELLEQQEKFQKHLREVEDQMKQTQDSYAKQKQDLEKELEARYTKQLQALQTAQGISEAQAAEKLETEKKHLEEIHQQKLIQLEEKQKEQLKSQEISKEKQKEQFAQEQEQVQQKIDAIEAQKAQHMEKEKELSLPRIAFGRAHWEKYYGSIGEEPHLPKDIEQILKSSCPYFPGKTVEETHLLTLIPKTVNGKPFTIGLLGEMIKEPQRGGHATKYYDYDNQAVKELKDRGIPASYWALITNDVLPNSRNKVFSEQQPLIKGPYAVPKTLEVATGILMHHVRSGERLYSDSPNTYTRCQEKVNADQYRVGVGSFGSSGLVIFDRGGGGYGGEHYGLGAARKF